MRPRAPGSMQRDFASPDYERLRDLLRQACARRGPDVAMTLGDLDYWRYQAEDPDAEMQSCRLWLDQHGDVLGFAWPGEVEHGAGVIDVFVRPDHEDLLDAMYDWSERWHGAGRAITTNCLESEAIHQAVLERRGYRRTDTSYHWYRVRPIDDSLPDGPCPDAHCLRDASPHDAAAIAEANNRAGAGPSLTPGACLAVMGAPTYRANLHIVSTPKHSNDVAAFCIVWFDESNRIGLFEPVACHPGHQRRGLATAVMCEGLRRLRDLGATHALLATRTDNVPANLLYERLGFAARGAQLDVAQIGGVGCHTSVTVQAQSPCSLRAARLRSGRSERYPCDVCQNRVSSSVRS